MCHYAECHYSECHYAECHYAECHYAQCHYAECRSALSGTLLEIHKHRRLTGENLKVVWAEFSTLR